MEIRYTLVEKISELTGKADEGVEEVELIFGWEIPTGVINVVNGARSSS